MVAAYKAPHEKWVADYVARAPNFVCCMFLGRGEFDKRWCKSLKEARRIKAVMLAEYEGKNYGRGVLIYAVTHDNLSIVVE